MYGVKDGSELVSIVKKVVSVFGGGTKTKLMMLEICCVETDFCTYPDKHPERLGVGPTQFDKIALDDLQERCRGRHRAMLRQHFGYELGAVVLADLAYDPLLAFCLTRMKLLLIPESIPTKRDARARYWKRYWNTSAGKGTINDYMTDTETFMPKIS
ncbi:hypothetical protein S144_44 [Shewanella sp. phage 1/44]|uniref:hypothetical protein n=1 Tax=Shewanella sp. phage 1/44 TaxID=1458862 RepID=UPI0004F89DD8|nr:hypothetical protein S144_44 [Shewanella sp. phage 1/44]AHK11758.1 hypothetical protein S144_44 [Shewanella sp. phage 1/44]